MYGTTVIIPVYGAPVVQHWDSPPDLKFMQDAVGGGLIETVPYFTKIKTVGGVKDCIAFCNEEAKVLDPQLEFNTVADAYWKEQVGATYPDTLHGPVLVLFGDHEFMEAL